jgi:hypothetical protein
MQRGEEKVTGKTCRILQDREPEQTENNDQSDDGEGDAFATSGDKRHDEEER